MKIIELRSENVKKVRAVTIRPDGAVVTIKGENGAGKSSVLDSIAFAIGGKDLQPPKVIREGAKKARVVLDLGDLVVERRWTASGSTLAVKSKDGAVFPSPQRMLDGLVGRLSFDPLAFMRMEPKKQAEALRQLVGLDFSALDGMRRRTFDERTAVGREVDALKGALARMPEVTGSAEPVDVAGLIAEQDRIIAAGVVVEEARSRAREAFRDVEIAADGLERIKRSVEELEQALANARSTLHVRESLLASAKEREKTLRLEAHAVAVATPGLEGIQAQLRGAESQNARARAYAARVTELERLKAREADAARLTEELKAIDDEKAEALAGATFPVPGLAFADEGVTFKGLPLEQASSAEQLRISLAMGLALNPKLKVVLIRDGSLLDEKSLALVAELAEAAGAQVWLERVGKGGVGIEIEDGHVAGEEPEAQATTAEAQAEAN